MMRRSLIHFYKANATKIERGDVILKDNKWLQVEQVTTSVKKARAKGQQKILCTSVAGGFKVDLRVKPGEQFEIGEIVTTNCEFLELREKPAVAKKGKQKGSPSSQLIAMQSDEGEEIEADAAMFAPDLAFLVPEMPLVVQQIVVDDDEAGAEIVSVDAPKMVVLRVAHATEEAKKASGSGSKKITLENGIQMSVPTHVNEGDMVELKLPSAEYYRTLK